MGISFLGVGFLATILSWFLPVYFGRRIIYNSGLGLLAVLQIVIGIPDCVPNYIHRPASLMILWNFFYDLVSRSPTIYHLNSNADVRNTQTIGPVCFVILCECSATRVRGKTIAFATAVQALAGIVMTVGIPYMINPDQANLCGKLGFSFGGLAASCFVWSYFRVPDTKGRTCEELDIMFERSVRARQFKDYKFE
jgi:SP family general alpha glucoside:H+ symporter-like MFS transporter